MKRMNWRHRLSGALVVSAALAGCASSPPVWQDPLGRWVIPLQDRAGTYYASARIAGLAETELLVDTGSRHMVVDAAMLEQLKAAGTAQFSHTLRATMADGSQPTIEVYRLKGLLLGGRCWVEGPLAAVFPDARRPILGMNVLAALAPFSFSVEPPALSLGQCQPRSTVD
jgi:hypothetical protein